MTPTSGRGAPKEPVDTTGDPALEAKWQALVADVIAAKADAVAAREVLVEAERGPAVFRSRGEKVPADVADAEAKARAKYKQAGRRVEKAAAAMKEGRL